MSGKDNLNRLQMQLCELKLQERRVGIEIKNLVKKNKTIDFYQVKNLSSDRKDIKDRIKSVEASIVPNIIA